MYEAPDNIKSAKNYSVKVFAAEIGWIFVNDKANRSYKFLNSLIDGDNVEVFKLNSVEMIVELLFKRFRSKII